MPWPPHAVAREDLPSALSGIQRFDDVHRPDATVNGKVAQTPACFCITHVRYLVGYGTSAAAATALSGKAAITAATSAAHYHIELIGHLVLLFRRKLGVKQVCQLSDCVAPAAVEC